MDIPSRATELETKEKELLIGILALAKIYSSAGGADRFLFDPRGIGFSAALGAEWIILFVILLSLFPETTTADGREMQRSKRLKTILLSRAPMGSGRLQVLMGGGG